MRDGRTPSLSLLDGGSKIANAKIASGEQGGRSTQLYLVKRRGVEPSPGQEGPASGGTTTEGQGGHLLQVAAAGSETRRDLLMPLLMSRTGGRCEARTPWCLASAAGGLLAMLPQERVNIHHRQPGKMGGTRRWHAWLDGRFVEHLPSLAEIVLVCGFGNTLGCHGWVESNREVAEMLGWLVSAAQPGDPDNPLTDPAQVVLVLPSRRRVLLTAEGGYAPPPDGRRWA